MAVSRSAILFLLSLTASEAGRFFRSDASVQGVTLDVLKQGDGQNFPKSGDTLTMHYTGTLASDGSKFDSSRDRNEPFEFQVGVGQVIQGWDTGIMKMSLGERGVLHVPSAMGYGAQGAGGVIPPNADLNFDVELLAINGKGAGRSAL